MLACSTVTSTGPEPSSGKVRPAICASMILLSSLNGMSIGTAMLTPPCVGGTIVILSGKGQSGLVSACVIRVSASMPMTSVIAVESMRGCAAMARVGLSSSQTVGDDASPTLCSGTERQALAHCKRAVRSRMGSLRTRSANTLSCSSTVLSITGLIWAGTLTRAPATERLVSPRFTCAVRFGSMRQAAASLGREVMLTLPLISALALMFLMFTLPICLATLPPSRPPSASPTAPVALPDSEPVMLSVPVSGVASDSTSWAPVAVIGPRSALQPISAFCSTWDTGLSALPLNVFGAPRSAASRIADSATATCAITTELRGAGGSGGNWTSAGGWTAARGASQSIAFRLIKNETATTAVPIKIVLRRIGGRIVPPDRLNSGSSTGKGKAAPVRRIGVHHAALYCEALRRLRHLRRQSKRKRPRRVPEPLCDVRMAVGLTDARTEIGAAIGHRQHDHLGADSDPRIEVDDVFVDEA